jgi:hypothetical protein
VAGLVGDDPVAGAAYVGVGDETCAQAMGGVGEWVDTGASDCLLDEVVDRAWCRPVGPGRLALVTRRNRGPSLSEATASQASTARTGHRVESPARGVHDEFCLIAPLVGLGSRDADDPAVGVFVDLADRERGDLGSGMSANDCSVIGQVGRATSLGHRAASWSAASCRTAVGSLANHGFEQEHRCGCDCF